LPDIGEGIVECEIVEWLVSEGDEIVEDQAVCDVMTDKALVQIPAKYTGKVEKLLSKRRYCCGTQPVIPNEYRRSYCRA